MLLVGRWNLVLAEVVLLHLERLEALLGVLLFPLLCRAVAGWQGRFLVGYVGDRSFLTRRV